MRIRTVGNPKHPTYVDVNTSTVENRETKRFLKRCGDRIRKTPIYRIKWADWTSKANPQHINMN